MADKDKKKSASKSKEGWYRLGSGLLWAGGQFAVNWFITYEQHLGTTLAAIVGAFIAGWTTAALLGRIAKWGAGANVMMVAGVIIGVAVFTGAFSGLGAVKDWYSTRHVSVNWEELASSLLKWTVLPPIGLGLLTGLYVRAKIPQKAAK